ncbi:phytanoyl-CoA dioxygenase family protein [Haloarcula amylolytica]|uniref:phytanoyl-CoA dioxygenase family protein n=1 Tax=Haloarcula amylolytica TaxID=396317 RepID=UPI003C70F3A3
MTEVRIGERTFEFGGEYLVELRDSSDCRDDVSELRTRLNSDGYLFIRDFHDPEIVADTRTDVLAHLDEEGLLDPGEPVQDAVVHPDWSNGEFDMSGSSWTHYPNLETMIEGDAVMEFFREFLGAKPFALDQRRGRVKPTGYFTGFHIDHIFMGRGTDDLYTLWRPVGDCSVEMGPLVVYPGSHDHERLRETYGQLDVDLDRVDPFFSRDAMDVIETIGGPLSTADFTAGDAIIFDTNLLHGSLTNRTDRFRISVDTRYQSIEEAVDPRWVGADPTGQYNLDDWGPADLTPMRERREEWGL